MMGQIDEHRFHCLANESTNAEVRRLISRAVRELSLGRHDAADALLMEANALEAATLQHWRAVIDARSRVSDLAHDVRSFWDRVADDRTLHDLADDASVLMALFDELDRAQSRLIVLEMTGP